MICSSCNEEIDAFGACDCTASDPATSRAEVLAFVFFIVFILAALGVKFVAIPRMERSEALELVEEKESRFLTAFHSQVAANPKLSIIGWECELVHPWGLVTYLYQDNPSSNERKAYFWCVHLTTKEVHRLRSLKQFVDDFLLKDEASTP